jgi:hypothetical protein
MNAKKIEKEILQIKLTISKIELDRFEYIQKVKELRNTRESLKNDLAMLELMLLVADDL